MKQNIYKETLLIPVKTSRSRSRTPHAPDNDIFNISRKDTAPFPDFSLTRKARVPKKTLDESLIVVGTKLQTRINKEKELKKTTKLNTMANSQTSSSYYSFIEKKTNTYNSTSIYKVMDYTTRDPPTPR